VVGVSIVGYLARAAACIWVEPRLAPKLSLFSRDVTKDLFSFGIWFSLLNFFRSATPNIAPFVIGHTLGAAPVTTFTIPRMLTGYANWVMVSATQVMAPKAAVYHFGDNPAAQRTLFIEGSRYNWSFTLFFLGGAVFLGYPLLSLWQSTPQQAEYRLLLILMAGELIPLSQWVAYYTVVSMGRHRRLAELVLAEAVAVLILAYTLSLWWGLEGAAAAVAICGFVFRGLFQLAYGCRLVGVTIGEYSRLVLAPFALMALPPFAAMAVISTWFSPTTWLQLFAAGVVYAAIFWPCMAYQLGLIPVGRLRPRRSP
jgi:O-antigen/teichoic acid export membrane protein